MATEREIAIRRAIAFLKCARDELRDAGANKAADYVARAMKSAEGAERHARCLAIQHEIYHGDCDGDGDLA